MVGICTLRNHLFIFCKFFHTLPGQHVIYLGKVISPIVYRHYQAGVSRILGIQLRHPIQLQCSVGLIPGEMSRDAQSDDQIPVLCMFLHSKDLTAIRF